MPKAPALYGEERIKVRGDMRAAYDSGLTVHQVAVQFSRSYGSTHQLLREALTEMRPQGGRS